jgi:hypothetical protein
MPPDRLRVAALCAVLLASAVAHGQALPVSAPNSPFFAPNPGLLSDLESERVVLLEQRAPEDGDRVARSEVLVLFQQPRGKVMRMLASTTRQIEYRTELERLHIVEAGEDSDLAEYRVRFMLTTLSYRARHRWDFEHGRVWWSLDPKFPNDMETLDGLWELRALDDARTLGHFSTRIDLGPAVPAFLQDYATHRKLPEAMEQIRRWVDSDGRWRP